MPAVRSALPIWPLRFGEDSLAISCLSDLSSGKPCSAIMDSAILPISVLTGLLTSAAEGRSFSLNSGRAGFIRGLADFTCAWFEAAPVGEAGT
jgi:hypothetical protein